MGHDSSRRPWAWTAQLNAPQSRRVLIAGLATVVISASLLGLLTLTRWRGHHALASDTATDLSKTCDQLVRAFLSRRGTLTFVRDTLDRSPDLTASQLQAMGSSATDHTRHLLGVALVRAAGTLAWWHGPEGVSRAELAALNQAVMQRTRVRGVWRVSSTFTATVGHSRPLLVMFEPLRAASYRHSAIVGVFDLRPLLRDFFASGLASRAPVRVLDGDVALYQSEDWQPSGPAGPGISVEERIAIDAARWTLKMQPGATGVVQTLSWLRLLLIVLGLLAGIGATLVVWILAARTWILQRAVRRRTAALRRTSQRLRQLARTDELTGVYNRRFFLDRWTWECERADRYQRPLACLMVDLDGFKEVNDRLGHLAGDLVLKDVARELQSALRNSDILARFGGDEFIVALPETTLEQAEAVADKLRQVVIRAPSAKGRTAPLVRLSVGSARIERRGMSPADVIQAADASMYAAKAQKRADRGMAASRSSPNQR